MPNRDARRSKKTEDDAPVMTLSCGGVKYAIEIAGFSALDEMDFERATEQKMGVVFANMGDAPPSMAVLAGFLWLHRRRTEKRLTFEQVARQFTFQDMIDGVSDDEDDDNGETGETAPED